MGNNKYTDGFRRETADYVISPHRLSGGNVSARMPSGEVVVTPLGDGV